MEKMVYLLSGLNCANCAALIQEEAGRIDGVRNSEVVFATQKLTVEVKGVNSDHIDKALKSIVKRIEPDVTVIKFDGTDISKDSASPRFQGKWPLIQLVISAVLFIAGLLLKPSFRMELIIFGSAYLLAGGDILIKAFKNILKGKIFDENFLMSIATLGALAIYQFSEAAAVMLFYRTGEFLQSMAVNNSRKSIKSLMYIRPDYANVKTPDGLIRLNAGQVQIGDLMVVKPGERVPLDGVIEEGSSFVDTSALTGEPVPREVSVGDSILSGSVNQNGLLVVKATRSFSESTVSRILDLVENAAARKAPAENLITRFARYYTPVVVITASLIALIPPVFGGMDFKTWLYRALVFLVISCPCALVISVPLTFFGGIGAASRKGILVKGSNYLEALNRLNAVVFDKTGTLTKGIFRVTEIHPENGFSKDELLEYAALAEAHSNHPIARSIAELYNKETADVNIQHYEDIPGHGVKAVINGRTIFAGNENLMHSAGFIEPYACHKYGTVVHVAVDEKYAGYILIADEIREDSAKTVSQLRELGEIRVAMLTGDNELSAKEVAGKLNIDEFYSELLPQQKVEKLEMLRQNTYKPVLAFIGDGINDAPVLAMADIGIAMGGLGSDAAIEAADIILMRDEPYKIVEAILTAKKTRRIVIQNIVLAIGVKLLVLGLGAAGVANMWEAVFADVGVTLLAVFNSLRVLKD